MAWIDTDGDGVDDLTGKDKSGKQVNIPASTPNISGPDGNAALEAALNEVTKGSVSSAVSAGATKMNAAPTTGAEEDWVLRSKTISPNPTYWGNKGLPPSMKEPRQANRPDALSVYEGEYARNIENPAFESWLVTRGWAFGRNLITKDGRFNTTAGREFWNWLGEVVAKNPETQKSVTPEMYADGRYAAIGGDTAFSESNAVPPAAPEQNPITTQTSVSRATMNPSAAEAAVDQLARGLLGRMASEKELNRYRKQINAFLSKNPTTSTSVRDATDPDNVKINTNTKDGASPTDAVNVLEMRMRRGSEGMAFNAGKMIEDALTGGSI